MGPLWKGDMDPTLSQILQHMISADTERARLAAQLDQVTKERDELKARVEELEGTK